MDFGWLVDGRTNQISGPKFGTASDTARTISYRQISHFSPPTGHPFMYVYKVYESRGRSGRFLLPACYPSHSAVSFA